MVFSGIGSNGSAFPFSRAFTRGLSSGFGAGNGFQSINSQSNFIGNSGRFSGLGNFGTGTIGNLTSLLNQIASNPAFTQSLSQNRLGSQSSTSGIVSLITQLVNQITQLIGVGNNTNIGNTARFVDGSDGPFDPNSVGGFGRNAFSNRQDLINQGLFNPATTTLRYTDRSNPNLNDLFGFSEEAIIQNDLNGNGNLSFSEYSQGFSDPNEARAMFQVLDRRGRGRLDAIDIAALGLLMDRNQDGQVTGQERQSTNNFILNNPEEARAQLDDIINSFGLISKYRQFQRQQGLYSGFDNYGSGFNSNFDNTFYAGGFSPYGSNGFDVRY